MSHGRAATERSYALLKAALLNIEISSTGRLDLPMMALRIGVSLTPCREAAFRLVGERLLRLHPGGGFQVPMQADEELRDLYRTHQILILASLDGAKGGRELLPPQSRVSDPGINGRARSLFARIARQSGNSELQVLIENLADRLASARLVESTVMADASAALEVITRLFEAQERGKLSRELRAYHRRRIAKATDIEAALARRRARAEHQPDHDEPL